MHRDTLRRARARPHPQRAAGFFAPVSLQPRNSSSRLHRLLNTRTCILTWSISCPRLCLLLKNSAHVNSPIFFFTDCSSSSRVKCRSRRARQIRHCTTTARARPAAAAATGRCSSRDRERERERGKEG